MPVPRWLVALLVAAGATLVLPSSMALGAYSQWGDQPRTLSSVQVAGVDVGGLTEEDVRARVEAVAGERAAHEVIVVGDEGRRVATHAELGLRSDVDATVAEALQVGREPVLGTLRYLVARARGAEVDVALDAELDESAARRWAVEVADDLEREPAGAELEVVVDEAPRVETTDPVPGIEVDEGVVAERVVRALHRDDERTVVAAPTERIAPEVDDNDLVAAQRRVEQLVAEPLVLDDPDGDDAVELTPADLAATVRVALDLDGADGESLIVEVDPRALEEVAGDRFAELEEEPADADIALEDGEVVLDDHADGRRVDVAATAEAITAAVAGGEAPDDRRVTLVTETVEPDRTRADAEDLGIVEEVSSFTTDHPCCQNRVHNIQRMADEVRGVVIEPGERFSLNDHVGPRSADRGWRRDQMIRDGEFVDVPGGGVSQFATTFFNAAFFAGVDLVEFQPHSQYIARYPHGREATISYGQIDLVIENNTDYGILIDTSYTDTSITVSFWSTEHLDVDTTTRPANAPGGAFGVTFERTVTDPEGNSETESWSHRYQN